MKFILLDVVQETWLEENGRDVLILSTMALIALGLLIGAFLYFKKRRAKKKA